MTKWKKRAIAAALTCVVVIGIKSCDNNIEQMKLKRPDYLKKELEKEIIDHKRSDLLDDLVRFSYSAKKAFDSPYAIPRGFSNEPYELWVETEKNARGEAIAYLVNHRTGSRHAILENDVVKTNAKTSLSDTVGKSFLWIYEAVNELYGG